MRQPMQKPDTYFALVKLFPLTHLRDDDHLDAAQEVIDRLLTCNLDEGEQDYLDVLTDHGTLDQVDSIDICPLG